MADFPVLPNSRIQYTQAASCGDLVCLLISLLKEKYITYLLKHIPIEECWFPNPKIKGDGLHEFRLANEWAAKNANRLSMKSFIDTVAQQVFLPN
mgnify:CR=1 FL=1